ncbi:38K [Fopius arisanus]|nr:38K [Fopius arisanus]
MISVDKPDLVVHPKFFNHISQYNLTRYFNVLELNDLIIETDIEPLIITDDACQFTSLTLDPFYSKSLNQQSGIDPSSTSYWFDEPQPIYTIRQNSPRYVIWPKNENLTICGTHVERIQFHELYDTVRRAKEWSFPITEEKSIIVFNLHSTLIDDENKKLDYADNVLEYAANTYDFVVLWSHRSPLDVDDNIKKFTVGKKTGEQLFDLILKHNSHSYIAANKNLLYLYNFFPNCRFTRATLVDDSAFNWTPEYNKFIMPKCKTLIHALPFIS